MPMNVVSFAVTGIQPLKTLQNKAFSNFHHLFCYLPLKTESFDEEGALPAAGPATIINDYILQS
ncbi:hypothetical protein C7N83_01695 [Neisseria iguanae]|uniref:Uncharacterized protein n=1 Tax=Neisseria iguanae TaxID=90242 RepID=A0A2P7U2W7_9NEIS|nr:hypothetical protein C7N83_03810 [Neisseria iguanae]PSJ81281.1 hypothetical protein C7N83_01695 [Neisseria iguanae]